MKQTFPELPEWTFDLDEVSAGVYEVVATDQTGHRVQAKGTDPAKLMEECRVSAARMREEVRLRRN